MSGAVNQARLGLALLAPGYVRFEVGQVTLVLGILETLVRIFWHLDVLALGPSGEVYIHILVGVLGSWVSPGNS